MISPLLFLPLFPLCLPPSIPSLSSSLPAPIHPSTYLPTYLCCCRCCCCCSVASVVSNSVRPHRWQPIRFSHSWDSPGKNTGVGCHFLIQCMKVKSESEGAQSCLTPSDPMDCSPPGSSIHGFSRQEYWSGVPLPSPYISIYLPEQTTCFYKKLFLESITPQQFSSIPKYTHNIEYP